MKFLIKKISVLILCVVLLLNSINVFAAQTNTKTPVSADEASLKWSLKLGGSYKDAPSVPTVYGDYLYAMSNSQLYKINLTDGEIVDKADMCSEPSFSYTPVLAVNGMIFCPLENGRIHAFDSEVLETLWIFKDSLNGQALTPIVYSDGFIYTGFWNDEDEDANFVCINAKTGELKWKYTSKGGFYWSECLVKGNYVIVGGDNSSGKTDAEGTLKCFDKSNGTLVDTIKIKGDQRSGITEYAGKLYFVTKAGYLYQISLNSSGKFENLVSLDISGASTSTPEVYNGRIYIGVQSSGFGGYLAVIDANSMSLIYTVPMNGYPQSEVLISNGYENDSGKVYIYSTYNAVPGGITVITDTASQTTAQQEQLFQPAESSQGYCISPITADSNGNLYYKNDSGTIFALEKKEDNEEVSFFKLLINLLISLLNLIRAFFGK